MHYRTTNFSLEVAFAELQMESAHIIVADERAGQVHFGKTGHIVEVSGDDARVNFNPGVDVVKAMYLADLGEMKSLKKLQKFAGVCCCFVVLFY